MPITESAAADQKIRWLAIIVVVVLSLSIAVTIPGLGSGTDGTVSAQQINETQENTTESGTNETQSTTGTETNGTQGSDTGGSTEEQTNGSTPAATDGNSQDNNDEGGFLPFSDGLISFDSILVLISILGIAGTWKYKSEYRKQKDNIEKSFKNLNDGSRYSLTINDESAEKMLKKIEEGKIVVNGEDGEVTEEDDSTGDSDQDKIQYIESKEGGEEDRGVEEQPKYERDIDTIIQEIDEMVKDNQNTAIGIALSKLVKEANQEGSDIDISEIKTQFKKALDKEKEYNHLSADLENYNLDGTIPDDPQWEQLKSELEDDDQNDELADYIRKLARSLSEYQRELKNAEETKQMYRKKANHYDAIFNGLDSEWIDENVENYNNKDDIVAGINSSDIGVRKISSAANDINRSDPPGTNFLPILQSPGQYDQEEIMSAITAVLEDIDTFRTIEADVKEVDREGLEKQIDEISSVANTVESRELKSAIKEYLNETERAIDTIPEDNHLEMYAYGAGLDNIQQLLDSIDTSTPQIKELDSLKREYKQTRSNLKSRQDENSHQITSIGNKIANHFVDMADRFTERADTEASNGNDEAAKSLYQGGIKLLGAVRELYDDKALRKHMRRL